MGYKEGYAKLQEVSASYLLDLVNDCQTLDKDGSIGESKLRDLYNIFSKDVNESIIIGYVMASIYKEVALRWLNKDI